MKIEEMADVFLNSANFAPHAFLTLAPPSGYALNLKALIKVSNVSWTSQLSYEILRSSLERKFDKTNFISRKSTPPKSPGLLGLTYWHNKHQNHQRMTQWQHHLFHYIVLLCNRFHSLLFGYYRHHSEIWYLVSIKWSERGLKCTIV